MDETASQEQEQNLNEEEILVQWLKTLDVLDPSEG